MDAVLRVRHHGRGTEPRVISQVRRHRHHRFVPARRIAGKADVDRFQFADAAVPDQFCGIPELRRRALLAANLKNAPGCVDRVAQLPSLGDGQRGGLLQVHVLAGAHGGYCDQRVPVIRRADDDGVDVAIGEQLAVVAVRPDAVERLSRRPGVVAVHQHACVLDALRVHIAHGDDLRLRMLPDTRQVVGPRDAPRPDRCHVDTVAGRGAAEHRRRNDGGEAGGK